MLPPSITGRELSPGNCADHDERLFSGNDRVGQGSVRRIVRQVFFAGKKTQECPPLQSYMIADCAPQHGIARFKHIKYRSLRDRRWHIESDFTANMGEVSKVCR
jgi:hypothetical protein